MNVEQYKQKRLKEIDEFLRDIKIEKLNELFSPVKTNPYEYSSNDEEMTKRFFHFTLKTAIIGLNGLYTELKDTNLCFGAATKEDVDKEIDMYVKKIMKFLEEFVEYIVNEYYQNIEKISRTPSTRINTSLRFYKFKIGDKMYDWYDGRINNQYNSAANECVVDNLKIVIEHIRDIPKQIKEKINKLEELKEIGSYFEEQSDEWKLFMNLYFSIKRSTDPMQIDEMYEEAKKLIPIKHK